MDTETTNASSPCDEDEDVVPYFVTVLTGKLLRGLVYMMLDLR